MAPIAVSTHLTLRVRNRSSQCWSAQSPHFSSEKAEKEKPIRIAGLSSCEIRCYNVDTAVPVQINLVDSRREDSVHQVTLPADRLLQQAQDGLSDGTERKWKLSYCSNPAHLQVLHRYTQSHYIELLLLPQRDSQSFLSLLPDSASLTSLCLPGTHESLARYGWPISTCQSTDSTVSKQLSDGIRYVDVRLAPKGEPGKERLLAYHGVTDERIELSEVLRQCFNFLDGQGRRETIIMSVKQESGVQDTFIKLLFNKYVDASPASKDGRMEGGRQRWFLQDRVPTLGEVRGKIVMLSRFVIDPSYGFPGGISPPIWPNSFKGIFEYQLRGSGQTVQTQDWYDIGSLSFIGDKVALISALMQGSGKDNAVLSLNYTNGSSFPFALPPAVAKGFLDDGTKRQGEHTLLQRLLATEGVNSQVRDIVAGMLFSSSLKRTSPGAIDGLKITWALDYYNEPKGAADLVPLLIEANF